MTRQPVADGSLAQQVYLQLLEAINAGHCLPGDRIREVEVAQTLGVSRTPVREALRRLESEEVLAKSTQGLVVVRMSEAEVLELYDLRESIEATAANLAAQHATREDRQLLARLLREEAACEDDDAAALAAINRRFHRAIAGATHNRFVAKVLNGLQDTFLRLRSSTLALPGRPAVVLAEHRAIVRAIDAGDPAGAARAARRHIRESRRARLRLNKLVAGTGSQRRAFRPGAPGLSGTTLEKDAR